MRRKLIAANWKMNGSFLANEKLLNEIIGRLGTRSSRVVICPPAPYLAQCRDLIAGSPIHLGAQDVSAHSGGAYTGEVAGDMLKDCGCNYVIIGHSERRQYHGETNRLVGKKVIAAIEAGLNAIVCVGETLAQREAGETSSVVASQIDSVLDIVSSEQMSGVLIAYEPVWAIGTGKTATPEMAQEVHALLREQIAEWHPNSAATTRILYGGSMKPDNAAQLLAMPDIDGGLIGGASLKADEFLAIIEAADIAGSANSNGAPA